MNEFDINDGSNIPSPPLDRVSCSISRISAKLGYNPDDNHDEIELLKYCSFHVWRRLYHIGLYTTDEIDYEIEAKLRRKQINTTALFSEIKSKIPAKRQKSKIPKKQKFDQKFIQEIINATDQYHGNIPPDVKKLLSSTAHRHCVVGKIKV